MKNHLFTIILLVVAAVAFALRFFVSDDCQIYCDIAAFALPTIAAIVEIVVSERSGKETEKQIKKLKDNQLSVSFEEGIMKFHKGAN